MSDPAPVETKVVEHVEASALPKPKRPFWRVVVVLLAVVAGLAIAFWVVGKTDDVRTLRLIAQWALGLVYFSLFVFVADGSAQDVVHLVTAFKSTRKETVMSAPPPATATPAAVVADTAPDAGPDAGDGELSAHERVRP